MRTYRRYTFPSLARVKAVEQAAHGLADAGFDGGALASFVPALDEAQLDEARRAGFDEGLAAGIEQGERTSAANARRDGQAMIDALGAPLEALIDGFAGAQREIHDAMRNELVALVGQVAKQVIRAELETKPEQVLAFAEAALAALPKAPDSVEVRLNEEDYRRVEAAASDYVQRWRIVPDARLEAGECRVKAGDHELDAGCGQRLAACLEQIAAYVARPREESTR
jgi:flagellar assembly protein FliH